MKVVHKREALFTPPKPEVKPTSRHPQADSFADTWKAVLKHTLSNGELHKQLMLAGPQFVKLFKEQPNSAATASAVAAFASFATDTPAVALDESLASSEIATILQGALSLVK